MSRRAVFALGPACLMALLLPDLPSASPAEITVRVGIYENNPKIFTDEHGEPAGFFPDLIRAIAKREGWKLAFVPGTWDECLASLLENKIDIMPDVAWTEERARLYDFAPESALSTWSQVYARDGAGIRSILDLDGKTIAILNESVQQKTLEKLGKQCGISFKFVACPTFDEVFQAVRARGADVAVVNRFFGAAHAFRYDLVATTVLIDPASLHFVARKGLHRYWLAAIDRDLKAFKEDAESPYHEAMDRWLTPRGAARWPAWLRWIVPVGAAILALALAFAGVLRWQLKLRSAELVANNKRLEVALEDLERAQSEVLKRERLRTLEQMAGGIANDLNNALNPILGYAEMLLGNEADLKDEAKVRKALGVISESAREGARIVERARRFAGERERGQPEVIGVGALLDELEKLSGPILKPSGAGRIMIERTDKATASVRVDEHEMCDALLNLIGNAVDAMPGGGIIRIRTDSGGGKVTITVEDTGAGMDEETLRNCMRPFFTTKGPRGTGMGLTATRSVVERHGGAIGVTSRPGSGTRVTIILPEAARADSPPRG